MSDNRSDIDINKIIKHCIETLDDDFNNRMDGLYFLGIFQ